MKVVVMRSFGGPEVLEVVEREIPNILDTEVLIHVKAAGVNRPDIFQRKGNYPAPKGVPSDVLGLEVAGVIVKVGKSVHNLKLGEHVMALVAGGGYSEYIAVDNGSCIVIPEGITFEEAAGMPETLFTVWHNVFQRGKITKGERFLVHGGAGGIGLTAIQLAHLFEVEVYTTVGSDQKKEFVEQLGTAKAFNYHNEDFETYLKDVGVDLILDSIGGAYFNKNLNILREEGRLVQINAMSGPKVELNLLKLMQKRISLSGSTLRNRSLEFKASLVEELKKEVMPFILDRSYKTYIEKVFPVEEVVLAHELMESRNFIGKIILSF